ncbi:DNA oxidative demethylase ALKBH2-like isoform X2 [Atheta coriaria]|uniref:DNA oxidative demethylase ALKBH2-like isoform X2 n=1 Tax=Dalotia coriaria TaxID=877792 RepID=UPI0031F3AA60
MRTENNLICDVNKQHKTMSASLLQEIEKIDAIKWHTIDGEQLNLSYASLFHKDLADRIFTELETSTEYYDADMCKVRVFGKYHNIPRKQVAHSDPDLVYRFSGSVVPGKPWTPLLAAIRDRVQHLTGGVRYNFVLINRYRNGDDYIGEHRDSEPELDPQAPIASVSFGAGRDFVLRHADVVRRRRAVPKVKIQLEHGDLLLMNPPTNACWYHSLPVRKSVHGVRINLTFRKLLV